MAITLSIAFGLVGGAGSKDPIGDSTRSFMIDGQETFVPHGPSQRTDGALSGEFGRYRIVKTLGRGAMGTVYLAEDTQLKRQVALKTPHFRENPSEDTIERFYREARAAATLRNARSPVSSLRFSRARAWRACS